MIETFGAIVRFDTAGHGVLVDDTHIVTCAHVMNALLGRELEGPESAVGEVVRVQFPLIAASSQAPPERWARIDAWSAPATAFEGCDVAGLTLVGESRPTGAVPMRLATEQHIGGEVLFYGPVVSRPGGWVSGKLRPLVSRHRQQIDMTPGGTFKARPGFSGTPVIEATETGGGGVVGLFVAVGDEDAYAIPLACLIETWPEVFSAIPPSPYKGLEAFQEEDERLFFGRDAFADRLERAVDAQGLVPVVGASGVGKSSLVRAGLLPRLRRQATQWRLVDPRPGPPSKAIAAAFARAAGAPEPLQIDELDAWERRIIERGLREASEVVLAATRGDRVLLLIDGFEQFAREDAGRDGLLSRVAELGREGRHRLVVVLTLREDYFGSLFVGDDEFGERLRRYAIALRGMDDSGLRHAIEAPANLHDVRTQSALVDVLVRDVRRDPGALPLLEFSLDRLWRTLRPGQLTLSFDSYEEIGRLGGALARYADDRIAALSQRDRAAVRRLFTSHLTSSERPDARRVVRRTDLVEDDWVIVIQLANERLLTVSRTDAGEEVVQVVHEALLREWGTLRTWIDEERPFRSWRQSLRYALDQWKGANCEETALLQGSFLVSSERWLLERPSDIGLEERRFIEVSRNSRIERENHYQFLYRASLARTLASEAEGTAEKDLSILLAAEALDLSPNHSTDHLLRRSIRRAGEHEGLPCDSPDREHYTRTRHRLTYHDYIRGRRHPRWLFPEVGETAEAFSKPIVAASYAPVVKLLAVATTTEELLLYRVDDEITEVGAGRLDGNALCLVVSAGGDLVAVAVETRSSATRPPTAGYVCIYRASPGLEKIARYPQTGFIEDVALNDTGDRIATLSHNGRIRVWDLMSGSQLCEAVAEIPADSLEFTPDASYVMVGRDQPTRKIPVTSTALANRARQIARRALTAEERTRYIGGERAATDFV